MRYVKPLSPKTAREVLLAAFFAVTAMWAAASQAAPLLWINSFGNAGGNVGVYDAATGATVNASLPSPPSGAGGVALDGKNHLLVSNATTGVVQYNATTGAVTNSAFIPSANSAGRGLAISGNHLFVASLGFPSNIVGEYDATTGAAINANFATVPDGKTPFSLAVDGNNHLFVTYGFGFVAQFDATTGATINPTFITMAVNAVDRGIAIDAAHNHIFVSDFSNNLVGEYDATTGAVINPAFISGQALNQPWGVALDGLGHLFVSNQGNNTVGEFDATTGAVINPAFVNGQGLSFPAYMVYGAAIPEPSTFVLASLGALGVLFAARRKFPSSLCK